jgi:hypothetical protein
MSYSIGMSAPACPTCRRTGEEPSCLPDPTYNLTGVFDLALTGEDLSSSEPSEYESVILGKKTSRPLGLRLLDGRTGADTEADLECALRHLEDSSLREKFESLLPPNGWGTLPDAVRILERLLLAARDYPHCTWRVR